MPDEKRREPRVAVGLSIKLSYGTLDDLVERQAVNISRGGLFIRTRDPKPVGTPVTLLVEVEGGARQIRAKGVVTRTQTLSAPGEPPRDPGMGVRLVEVDPAGQTLIDEIVSARLPEPSAAGAPPRPTPAPPPASPAAAPPALAPPSSPAPSAAPPRPAPKAGKAPVVGIDLGTTNSCVAVVQGGKARVLSSRQGYSTIPSVAAFDEHGRLLVGHAAKGQMVVNPRNTVYGSKRLVGRMFASPTVQACRDRFHYEIVEGQDGAAAVRFAGRDFSLQQVSALVLQEIRSIATEALGFTVDRAIITVPAYYNDHQRQAVREAGRLAGLDVARIVNEPTAAALAFGHGRGLDERVLIYDLGGGTFDASVLEIQGDIYEVVSTGGDTFLGGVDFDNQLVDHLAFAFVEKSGAQLPDDRVVWQRLRDAAEETKIALSTAERAVARVPYLARDASGQPVDLEVEVTRAELERLTGRLVDRSIQVCKDVLGARGLTPADLDDVLLVGGQSRMPLVWKKIREAFGREPNKSIHPDEAVAVGAALLADSETRIDSVVLIDVLAMGIGVGLPGGRMSAVLPRNSRLPARKGYEIATTRDGQTELELAVFQGDSPKASECEYLGTVRLQGLPAAPKGEVRLSVDFSLGQEGILSVEARHLATGEVTSAHLATLDTPESLREKLQIPEVQRTPAGARPLDVAREGAQGRPPPRAEAAADGEKKGLLGRFFGRH
ncbi:MAG TPA: TIGR02266 family protein [Anaeromyxobacteraceae bacterium]|jgi:molecular chaperone DnaK|nr:TIGR02266 family protein [Anaeromyxobacteraceae bacterium]